MLPLGPPEVASVDGHEVSPRYGAGDSLASVQRQYRSMDPVRIGLSYRALRLRRCWRQEDLAVAAGLSREKVSRVERGRVAGVLVGDVARIAAALEADLDLRLRWHGEGLDRLLDGAHSGLVDGVVGLLRREDWETAIEVAFSMWGERGSVDVFARHAHTGMVLVVEVKSVVPDSQAMLHALDRKVRLAPEVAKARGWRCSGVARLLVVGESSTPRRRIAAIGATYRAAFPAAGWAVRRWLREPDGPMSGLLLLPYARGGVTSTRSTGVQRVRKRGISPRSPHTRTECTFERDEPLGSR